MILGFAKSWLESQKPFAAWRARRRSAVHAALAKLVGAVAERPGAKAHELGAILDKHIDDVLAAGLAWPDVAPHLAAGLRTAADLIHQRPKKEGA